MGEIMEIALIVTMLLVAFATVWAIFTKKVIERELLDKAKMHSCLIEFKFEGEGHFVIISDQEDGLSVYVNGALLGQYTGEAEFNILPEPIRGEVTIERLAVWKRYIRADEEFKPVYKSEDYIK
jgi:hypothetical protein